MLKSRGMAHSNQIREFLISKKGIDLTDVYVGQGMVLTGAARKVQEMKEQAEAVLRREELERLKRELERKRVLMEAKIKEIRADHASAEEKLLAGVKEQERIEQVLTADRGVIAGMRKADTLAEKPGPGTGRQSRGKR